MKSRLFPSICGFAAVLASASSLLVPQLAQARTLAGPNTVRYNAGVIDDFCSMQIADGQLGSAVDRKTITSDPTQIAGTKLGTPVPATVQINSNLPSQAVLIADVPTLSGPSSASTSMLSLGANPYAATSRLTADASGAISAPVNVLFTNTTASGFTSGTYTATATLTCTSDGTK